MIEKIGRSLSLICRFGGDVQWRHGSPRFYSVAEHCVHMCRQARKDGFNATTQLAMLLHDAPEIMTGDMLPLAKHDDAVRGPFTAVEIKVLRSMIIDLNLPLSFRVDIESPIVKEFDQAILAAESKFIANPQEGWEPYDEGCRLHHDFARRIYLADHLNTQFKHWATAYVQEYQQCRAMMS